MEQRGKANVGSGLKPAPPTWLNRYRREAQVSQNDLASATGISVRTLQRLENAEITNPPLRYLVSCAEALGLADWHLLLEEEWVEPLPGTRPAARNSLV